jgi:hypothetical protein
VYLARVSLGQKSRNSRRVSSVGIDWITLNNGHHLLRT